VFSDLASKGSGRQYSNVQKFLALSRDSGGANLSEFLRRIQDLQIREAREGEALGGQPEGGAVQLMSIHAAKGLEFPVVTVADLGRGRRGRFGSNRLLHDPTFGIVCMGRDEDGDWHEPVSYTWASWLDERMEEAERKRLLYVACTRAADLLILSGKVGIKNSWLHQLMSVWEIEPSGEKEEVLTKDGYSLRVFRPDIRPIERPPSAPLLETTPGPVAIPSLARSLESRREGKVISVTDLINELSGKEPGRSKIPSLADPERSRLPRSYHIGRIVHRALKKWSSLSLSHHQLTELLEEYAQKEGVSENDIEHTVTGSRIMLYNVKNSDLYAKIENAQFRHQELPFTLRTAGYIIPGIVDIIFQDQAGIWHLLDWKTEWTDPKVEVVLSDEHLQQMAIYSTAMEKVLGAVPKAALCFLNPRWIHRPISRSQLEITRRQMLLND
jgi:ATP-dependent exoDNAse (exonuclease V) beta subunit